MSVSLSASHLSLATLFAEAIRELSRLPSSAANRHPAVRVRPKPRPKQELPKISFPAQPHGKRTIGYVRKIVQVVKDKKATVAQLERMGYAAASSIKNWPTIKWLDVSNPLNLKDEDKWDPSRIHCLYNKFREEQEKEKLQQPQVPITPLERERLEVMKKKQQEERQKRLEAARLKMKQRKEQDIAKEAGLCVICMLQPISHIAYPCSHFRFCGDCIFKMGEKCAICRCPVKTKSKVF